MRKPIMLLVGSLTLAALVTAPAPLAHDDTMVGDIEQMRKWINLHQGSEPAILPGGSTKAIGLMAMPWISKPPNPKFEIFQANCALTPCAMRDLQPEVFGISMGRI